MDDLISRKAAIEHLKKRLYETELNSTAKYPYYEEIADNRVDTWMNELPSAEPEREKINEAHNEGYDVGYWAGRRDYEPKWIPVTERLPEDGEKVLATHLGGLNPERQVIEHIYVNGKFTMGWDMDMNRDSPTFGQRYMGDVIAWMSFPKPYNKK